MKYLASCLILFTSILFVLGQTLPPGGIVWQNCTKPHEYYDCGSACQTKCRTLGEVCPIVNVRCNDACYCTKGCTQHMEMDELEKCMSEITELKSEVKIGTAKDNEILYVRKQGIIRGICQGKEIKIQALIDKDFENEKSIYTEKNVSYTDVNDFNYVAGGSTDKNLWHRRLGHVNRYSLRQLGLPFSNVICNTCVEGKCTRKPFYKCEKKTTEIGELIHSDIAGPIATPTTEGHKYFQVLIDDYSQLLVVKLLKQKSEGEQNVIDFIRTIKTQHGLKTKRIRVDNGGEFVSYYFKNYCRNKGIALEYTLPYTPRKNGTAERMNRNLLDKVRTKFAETNLPRELWGEVILCSAYELSMSPTEANSGETPAQRWYNKNDLSKLRVFGIQAWAVILPRQSKQEKRAEPCIMVGYTGAGYRLWNNEKNEIISSRDVRFNERNTNYNEILKNTKDKDSRKIIQKKIKKGKY
ncbi:hypothetical protein JTB14_000231 [Gonioctena quinquepunctata]|nr:hypothetical protein JTB14_000231 [Gonioctena quinquepunctata]